MKKLAALALLCSMATSSFAIGIGNFKINPELGASFGGSTYGGVERGSVGGYARVWLFGDGLTIAPMYKYTYTFHPDSDIHNVGYSNHQAGGLVGYRIFRFTPYVGASYSGFSDVGFADTTALNYGIYFDIPVVPLSIGIDATWQNPKIMGTDSRSSQHQFALTLGLIF